MYFLLPSRKKDITVKNTGKGSLTFFQFLLFHVITADVNLLHPTTP